MPQSRAEAIDALVNLGGTALPQGDFAAVRAFTAECLALAREAGDKRAMEVSLQSLGLALCLGGDPEAARAPLEESLTIAEEAR